MRRRLLGGAAAPGAGLPGRGTAFFPKKAVGKKGPGGESPRHPPKRGATAAAGCTGKAKPGVHPRPVPFSVRNRRCRASGGPRRSPRRPCRPLRCTGLARRAAIGAILLKHLCVCVTDGISAEIRRPMLRARRGIVGVGPLADPPFIGHFPERLRHAARSLCRRR